jgi:hypothetical protein
MSAYLPTSSEPMMSLGIGSDERGDVGPATDGDDPAVGDGERLDGGPGVVDGQYGSGDDEICVGHVQKS